MKSKTISEAIKMKDPLGFKNLMVEMIRDRVDYHLNEMLDVTPLPLSEATTDTLDLGSDEKDVVIQLRTAATHSGAKNSEYSQGQFTALFTSKQAASDFGAYLDAFNSVEDYDIFVPALSTDEGDIEWDNLDHVMEKQIEVVAYLDPSIVMFPAVEMEVDDSQMQDLSADENGVVINEVKRKVKINFRGARRIKMQCRPGFKWNPNTRSCQKIAGSDRNTMRIAHRKASRTRKAAGTSFKRRVARKSKKAMRFRKSRGL